MARRLHVLDGLVGELADLLGLDRLLAQLVGEFPSSCRSPEWSCGILVCQVCDVHGGRMLLSGCRVVPISGPESSSGRSELDLDLVGERAGPGRPAPDRRRGPRAREWRRHPSRRPSRHCPRPPLRRRSRSGPPGRSAVPRCPAASIVSTRVRPRGQRRVWVRPFSSTSAVTASAPSAGAGEFSTGSNGFPVNELKTSRWIRDGGTPASASACCTASMNGAGPQMNESRPGNRSAKRASWRAAGQALDGLEPVHHGQAVRIALDEPLKLAGKDHRALVAVRVHQNHIRISRRQCGFDDRDDRRDAASARPQQEICAEVGRSEPARRRQHLDEVTHFDVVAQPIRAIAAGGSLDRHLGRGIAVRGTGQRVTAGHRSRCRAGYSQGEELAGLVSEHVLRPVGNVEEQRSAHRRSRR